MFGCAFMFGMPGQPSIIRNLNPNLDPQGFERPLDIVSDPVTVSITHRTLLG
jgi:hypothetical protein